MKIDYSGKRPKYFDDNGKEINAGDTILYNGREEKVYLTTEGELGTDATNPHWIETGRAVPCEYGIYPFSHCDSAIIVGKKRKNE